MNRHVGAIAGRLSLRPPQREALEILDRVCELAPPKEGADPSAVFAAIRGAFPAVTDFEREFWRSAAVCVSPMGTRRGSLPSIA